jgi:hypothetical protein
MCRSDRCYLIMWDNEKKNSFSVTHEWYKPGLESASETIHHKKISDFNTLFQDLNQNCSALHGSIKSEMIAEPLFFSHIQHWP